MMSSSGKKKHRVTVLSRAVYPIHGYGGLERHVYHQLKHLSALGHDIKLITETPERFSPEDAIHMLPPGINVEFVHRNLLPLPKRRGLVILSRLVNYPALALEMARRLMNFVENNEIDVIYAHGLTGWGVAEIMKREKVRTPFILNPHGMEEFKSSFLKHVLYYPFRRKMRVAARAADAVVATDRVMIEEVESYLRVNEDKVVVLPNAVDIEECVSFLDVSIQQGLRESYLITEKDMLFISVGRLEANKGIIRLIRQLHRFLEKLPQPWRLLIIGKGSQQRKIQREIDSLSLSDNVILMGSVSDKVLHNLYAMADVFLIPSLYEGSSIATLEAMVHACPVVANSIGGLPDKIENGVNGLLCDPSKPERFGEAIVSLSGSDESDLRKMGENSRKVVEGRFSWSLVARESVDLFDHLLAKSNPKD